MTALASAVLGLTTPGAWALGLGRLSVQSALGESLRAEIDVTSISPEEAENLRVRIAAPEAYRSAGVDYNAVLPGTKAVLLRRTDGRPYLSLTSDRVVQEPFVDVILEMSWATGRLVREYTLLFDPPSSSRALAAAPPPITSPIIGAAPTPPAPAVQVPAPPPPVAARVAPPRPAASSAADSRVAQAPAPRATPPRPVAASEPSGARQPPAPVVTSTLPAAPAGAGSSAAGQGVADQGSAATVGQYRVRPGDTLSGIATRTQQPGTSLDQMLVSLYRGNPQAFIGDNMNRLRTGVTLGVPSAAAARSVTPGDARSIIQAQSADFGSYRQRLAVAVPAARTEYSTRQASGQVQAKVDDRQQAAAPVPDKLTLTKGEAAKAAAEEKLSKEREQRDRATRVAELSKNVDELSRLSGGAAPGRPAPPAGSAPPQASSAPAAVPGSVAAASSASRPVVGSLPGVAISAAEPPLSPPSAPAVAVVPPVVTAASAPASPPLSSPATASSPVLAQSPARSASVGAASAVPVATTEPSLIGSIIEDNTVAFGVAGALLALLAGFGIYRFTRRAKPDSGETSFLESRLQPDSFFGASGGQRIDTRETAGASSSMNYSLSQLDAIGDVDPVAEADVYLAYGRDLQAEEILKEAMRSTPERMAIRTKLLEVYMKRRDTKGFELLATQLYSLTGGGGADWAKAQEMGRQIDPENSLYQPGGGPALPASETGRPMEPLGASTMPQTVLPSPSQFDDVPSGLPANTREGTGLDLDLDLDLDSSPAAATRPSQTPAAWDGDDLNAPFAPTTSAVAGGDGALPDLPPSGDARSDGPPAHSPLEFDLSSISLDLDGTSHSQAPADAVTAPAELLDLDDSFGEAGDDPLSRKLELAEEFRQIGDVEGARDLLQEVAAKGSGALKTRAQGMLDTLS